MTKKIILITLFVLFAGALVAGGIYRTSAKSGYDISLGGKNGIEITQGSAGATAHGGQGANAEEHSQDVERTGQGLGNSGEAQGRNQKSDAAPAEGSSGQGNGRSSESQELGQGQGQGQGRDQSLGQG
ncbi:MAG: hypothetical protein ACK2U0_20600, partial [Candidatus Promineifilaceae bacterium]